MDKKKRFEVLDGWRGVSILMVLAAHLLPLGPKSMQLNATAGPIGMALFFTLSGFLITNFLYNNQDVYSFLVRRLFRIIPLAWLYIAISFIFFPTTIDSGKALFFFYANWPPMSFTDITSHFWSLCVEMQFYIAIATIVFFLKKRGLWLIPLLCVLITINRVNNDIYIAINSYYRMDEILAGSVIALIYNSSWQSVTDRLSKLPSIYFIFIFVAFIVSCHPASGSIAYFRPYFAATLVMLTLYNDEFFLSKFLFRKELVYLGAISYSLYVIHPILAHSWIGDGDSFEKYLKRPLLFIVLFIIGHISTYYYESHWISLAKRITGTGRSKSK